LKKSENCPGAFFPFFSAMAKICDFSGKKPASGHNVSHSVRRTKRRFIPNLQWKRIFDPIAKKWVRVRIAASALRTICKKPSRRDAVRAVKKSAE